jgi:KUP system potassium uptake protein
MNLKSPDEEDYLGILSLMLWTLSMIGVVKYVLLALRADDRGEGMEVNYFFFAPFIGKFKV